MDEQVFADMFERYAKTPRGIAFLNKFLSTAMTHCTIEHDDSNECFGTVHTVEFSGSTTECMVEELNEKG